MLLMFFNPKILTQILVQIALSLHLCALLVTVLPNSAVADPVFFQSNTHKITFKTSFFESDSNFTPEGGSFERLEEGKYFNVFNLGILWEQVTSKRTAWRIGLTGAQAKSSNGSLIKEDSDLTKVSLGYQYFLRSKPIKIKPEIFVLYPIKNIEQDTDEVLLSEGVLIVKLGLWFQKRWLSLNSYAYLGYTHRSEGRSSLAEYTFGTKKKILGFEFGAEILGFYSVTDDEYTNNSIQRSMLTDLVNGGSRKFYSVNPDLLTSKIYIKTQVGKYFSVQGGYGFDIQGTNIGKGNTIYFDFIWSLDPLRSKVTKSRRKKVKNDNLKKFNIETDEYDESLFEESKHR